MDKNEKEFTKKLEELKELASSQGMKVSKEQVEETFSEIGITGDALNYVYDYLKNIKIGVGEAVDLDSYLTGDEKKFLDMYLEEIGNLPKLSDGEKEAYLIQALAGEKEGRDKTVEMMLPVVVDISKLYTEQGVLIEDLIGEGNVALMAGVDMLEALDDPSEVESTLSKMVMNAMETLISHTADGDSENRQLIKKMNEILAAAKELSETLEKKITVEELAAEGKFSEEEIRDAIRISSNHIKYFEGAEED